MPKWSGREELEKMIQEMEYQKAQAYLIPPTISAGVVHVDRTPPPPPMTHTGMCVICGGDDLHTHKIPPPTPQRKMVKRQGCSKDIIYSYDGTSQCVCNICTKVRERREPIGRRYWPDPPDPFDTEYEKWRVDAGLIEAYGRRMVNTETGEVIDPEIRWRLTDLGQNTVHWTETYHRLPSGSAKKKITIDWDYQTPIRVKEPLDKVGVFGTVLVMLLFFTMFGGTLVIAALGLAGGVTEVMAIPMVVVCSMLITGRLVPKHIADRELEKENN